MSLFALSRFGATMLLCVALATFSAHAAGLHGVGFKNFEVRDPVGGSPMPAVAFYPSTLASGVTGVGPYRLNATKDIPIAHGPWPLIVFSHGTSGSMYDEHDLATGLAQRGYVVAVVQHAGDNFRDRSGLGTDRVLIGRELQLSALINTMLTDASFRGALDTQRIGAMGFSAGGYDVLLLAGAKPSFAQKNEYCREHPSDATFCGWNVAITDPALHATPDTRVRAILAISPVGLYFDREGLRSISVPVDIWAAGNDDVLPLDWNAERIRNFLPAPPRFTVVPKAKHLVFISPCTKELATEAAFLCTDPAGVDRGAIHAQLIDDAARFFRASIR